MSIITTLRPNEKQILQLLVLGLYLLAGLFFLQEYLLWDSQWILALLLAPLVAQVQPQKAFSPGLLAGTTVLALLALSLQNSTLYFFAFITAAWFGVQLILGRIAVYPLLLLTVASPIFKYIANTLSFPLRMHLTTWAVAFMNAAGIEAEAAGNIILIYGEEYAVDPACAGLSMLSLSLILAVFILAHLQRVKQKVWSLKTVGLMLGLVVVLNLLSNLLRILLLVWYKIMPDNPMHDVIGLACLLVYTLVPFYFLAYRLQPHLASPASPATQKHSISLRGSLLLNYLLLLLLTGIGITLQRERPLLAVEQVSPLLAGFVQERLNNGVTKYTNQKALVYLKPVKAFYSTEHHPLVCWEGSGYKFRHVQQRQMGIDTVFVGQLQKGNDTLYTAWWMDNGQHHTTNQLDWRWRMLKGEPNFRLINVTAANHQELESAIDEVMDQVSGESTFVASAL